MFHIEAIEALGVTFAAVSEKSDADCALPEPVPYPKPIMRARQVHGTRVASVNDARAAVSPIPDADGLLTDSPGIPLGISVADCVPIFLYAPGVGAGGVIHAGRVGTLNGIAAVAIAQLQEVYGANVADIHAAIGPSAGPCCYEVSPEISGAFVTHGLPVRGRYLDLWQANAHFLERSGVPRRQIAFSQICTICDGRFHSYRGDSHTSARNIAIFEI